MKKYLFLILLFSFSAGIVSAACPSEAPVSVNLQSVPSKITLTCASEWPIKLKPGEKDTMVACLYNPDEVNEVIVGKANSAVLPDGFIYFNSIFDVTLKPNETKCGLIKSIITYQPIVEINTDPIIKPGNYFMDLSPEINYFDSRSGYGKWDKNLFRFTFPVKIYVDPVCGNNSCEEAESCFSCSSDCGSCPVIPPPVVQIPKLVEIPKKAVVIVPAEDKVEDLKDEELEIINKNKEFQKEIIKGCKEDPVGCSCQQISCDDLSDIDHPKAKTAYKSCVLEKIKCEKNRETGIREIEKKIQKIEADCGKDLKKCVCLGVESKDGKNKCELVLIEAKYRKEKEKEDRIRLCKDGPDACVCSDIKNKEDKKECEEKLTEAGDVKEKNETACRENPINCDCSSIEGDDGKAQCNRAKKGGMEEASDSVKAVLSGCFKDIEKCDCRQLGLKEESFVNFCEIQKSYGLSCKQEGISCGKLDELKIYPSGVPAWLGKFFAKSYKNIIEKEKENGAKVAVVFIKSCLENPENCNCEDAPVFARAFCDKNKALQVKCDAGIYDACTELDNAPDLPEGAPSFSVGFLDKFIGKLKNIQAQIIKTNDVRKFGDVILACMDDVSKCDCSAVLGGDIKLFCEHKRGLISKCGEEKHFESCFALNEEPIVPEGILGVARSYIENAIIPKAEEKKQAIFDAIKKDTVCADTATIKDCKKLYYK